MEKYIKRFLDDMNTNTSRYKSWEHCYFFFKDNHTEISKDKILKDLASLHLAFYLASWGMYRGSSFLLQYDYKIHIPIVSILCKEEYQPLFNKPSADLLMKLKKEIIKGYEEFTNNTPTDTLISKIILGINGAIIAYDKYAKKTLKEENISQTLNRNSIDKLVKKISENDFLQIRNKYKKLNYPDMKLLDMYLFTRGLKLAPPKKEKRK